MTIWMPVSEAGRIIAQAQRDEQSVSATVRRVIEQMLKERKA